MEEFREVNERDDAAIAEDRAIIKAVWEREVAFELADSDFLFTPAAVNLDANEEGGLADDEDSGDGDGR